MGAHDGQDRDEDVHRACRAHLDVNLNARFFSFFFALQTFARNLTAESAELVEDKKKFKVRPTPPVQPPFIYTPPRARSLFVLIGSAQPSAHNSQGSPFANCSSS